MQIYYNPDWVVAVFFCSLRLAPLLAIAPILGAAAVPNRIKLVLILALAACVTGNSHVVIANLDEQYLILAALREVVLGGMLAFGVYAAFATFAIAGRLMDMQIGFSVGGLLDPVTQRQSPVLASLLDRFAVLAFFISGAHHIMMRGFVQSIERVPLGGVFSLVSPSILSKQIGLMFGFGLALAAPVVFCLLIVEIGLAVLSRNIPQLNVFSISLPLKTLLGLLFLAIVLPYLSPISLKIFSIFIGAWDLLLPEASRG